MKSFKEIIKEYLENRAKEDSLFAVSYAKEKKNIDDCCTYIMNRAKKMQKGGCAAVEKEEVFGWAVHYYDEDDIKVDKSVKCKVEKSKSVPKTDTPKFKAKTKKVESNVKQLSFFDL